MGDKKAYPKRKVKIDVFYGIDMGTDLVRKSVPMILFVKSPFRQAWWKEKST